MRWIGNPRHDRPDCQWRGHELFRLAAELQRGRARSRSIAFVASQDIARLLPFTYAVSLLRGISHGAGWAAHAGDVAALAMMFAVFTVVSTWAFRWE